MGLFSRAPAVTDDMRSHGLVWKRLPDGSYIEACDFCGGNCGQCGMTSRLGNQGFSMARMGGAVINGVEQPPLDGGDKRQRVVMGVLCAFGALAFLALFFGVLR